MKNSSFVISDSPLATPRHNNEDSNDRRDDESSNPTPKAIFVKIPEGIMHHDDDKNNNNNNNNFSPVQLNPDGSSAAAASTPTPDEHPLSEQEYAAAKALQERMEEEKRQKENNMFLEDEDDEEDMEKFVKKQKARQEEKKLKQLREQRRNYNDDNDANESTSSKTSAIVDSSANAENAFLSTVDYSSHVRYGFPCRLDPPIAVREEARCRMTLLQHNATVDAAWMQSLRGMSLLSQADSTVCDLLKKLCRKYGCPPNLRSVAWMTMTKVACKIEEHHPQGYGAMLEKAMPADLVIPELTKISIEQDLDRTFPEHPYFRRNAEGHRKLRWILYNLYRRSPINGYCQSFNFIAATFLLVLGGDLEATLWLLILYFETLLPNDYYNSQLEGVKIDQRVLEDVVRLHLPKISQHFDEIGYDVGMQVPVWIMSGFTNCLPIESAIAVWDWILGGDTREETPGLLIVACALLKMNSEEILMTEDPNDVAMLLSRLADITFDWPKLLKAANELALVISGESVQSLRRKHRALFQQEEAKKESKRVEKEAAKKRLENLKKYGATTSPKNGASANGMISPLSSTSSSSTTNAATSAFPAISNSNVGNSSYHDPAGGNLHQLNYLNSPSTMTNEAMFILPANNNKNNSSSNNNGNNGNNISSGVGGMFGNLVGFFASPTTVFGGGGGAANVQNNNNANNNTAVSTTLTNNSNNNNATADQQQQRRQRSDTHVVAVTSQAKTTFGTTASPTVIISTVEMVTKQTIPVPMTKRLEASSIDNKEVQQPTKITTMQIAETTHGPPQQKEKNQDEEDEGDDEKHS